MDIDRFLRTGGRFAPATKDQYRKILADLNQHYPDNNLSNFTDAGFEAWLDGHSTWHSAMRWVAYCCIRKYIKWAHGHKHLALDLIIEREATAPQRCLTFDQTERLLTSFDTSQPKGRRDLAICALLLDCGLRRTEVCSLELAHLHLWDCSLYVKVKGGKWKDACYSEPTAAYISTWLADRTHIVRPGGERYAFVSITGNTQGRKLHPGGLEVIVRRWAAPAGLERLSPHDLRRTFATLASKLGANSRILQKAGRWNSLDMVEHYTATISPADMAGCFPTQRILSGDVPRHKTHNLYDSESRSH